MKATDLKSAVKNLELQQPVIPGREANYGAQLRT
jgi:hypothetical protein